MKTDASVTQVNDEADLAQWRWQLSRSENDARSPTSVGTDVDIWPLLTECSHFWQETMQMDVDDIFVFFISHFRKAGIDFAQNAGRTNNNAHNLEACCE